ncbi:MAG: FG-GAP-like repeat-containing protein [Myxococcota bacterium]
MKRALLIALWVLGFGCGGDDDDPGCRTVADCMTGNACIDGRCVTRDGGVDAGFDAGAAMCPAERACRGGATCCPEGEECVENIFCFPVCENTRCGDNQSVCCGPDQTCLDGVVCAADCTADRELCGADLELCCDAGDTCVANACVTPGIECGDDFDCRDDALYCEPTLGRCLPTPSGDACEVRPDFEDVALVEEWHWDGFTDASGTVWSEVITTPVTGDVSGDGIPDVVVPAYTGTRFDNPVLVAINGRTGETLWVIERTDAAIAAEAEGTVLANFDPADDALEVAYRLDSGGFRIVDGDGVTEIARRAGPNNRGTIEVADLNADGTPDLVLGCHAYDGTDPETPASDLFDQGTCLAGPYAATSIADLDGDGEPEVTSGRIAVNADGTVLWDNGGAHALTAIADLDLDLLPEVITVVGGNVRILSGATGEPWGGVAPLAIPGGGTGGAPTVADFDGDGLPEIAAAGQAFYTVYDLDCFSPAPRDGGECGTGTTNGILWSTATQDLSSSVTGSSVFDFQGDGVAEVVYNDECFLHIYDGETGRELLADPIPNSSRTGFEYPTVVDVDGDGNSEIVVIANRDQAVIRDDCPDAYAAAFGVPIADLPAEFRNGTTGVFAYGDPGDRWVGTRAIWNQFSYHVTNVEADGTVPATEADNWTTAGLNNYRQNVQGRGIFNAPNLAVELTAVEACGSSEIRLSAVVTNAGTRGVASGVAVEFARTDTDPEEIVGSVNTTRALPPGASERVTIVVTVPLDTDLVFEARVDGDESVVECIEDDNVDEAMTRCPSFG